MELGGRETSLYSKWERFFLSTSNSSWKTRDKLSSVLQKAVCARSPYSGFIQVLLCRLLLRKNKINKKLGPRLLTIIHAHKGLTWLLRFPSSMVEGGIKICIGDWEPFAGDSHRVVAREWNTSIQWPYGNYRDVAIQLKGSHSQERDCKEMEAGGQVPKLV